MVKTIIRVLVVLMLWDFHETVSAECPNGTISTALSSADDSPLTITDEQNPTQDWSPTVGQISQVFVSVNTGPLWIKPVSPVQGPFTLERIIFRVSATSKVITTIVCDAEHVFNRVTTNSSLKHQVLIELGGGVVPDSCLQNVSKIKIEFELAVVGEHAKVGNFQADICITPVDGGWSDWENVKICKKSKQRQKRTCNNPPPANYGADCVGPDKTTVSCQDPIDAAYKELEDAVTAFKRVKPEFIMDINAQIQHDSNRGASALVLRQGEVTMFDLEQACEEFELNAAEMKERINGLKKLPGDQQNKKQAELKKALKELKRKWKDDIGSVAKALEDYLMVSDTESPYDLYGGPTSAPKERKHQLDYNYNGNTEYRGSLCGFSPIWCKAGKTSPGYQHLCNAIDKL